MTRFALCCGLVLALGPMAPAQEKSWSERFPAIARRIAHLDRRLAAEDVEIRKGVLTELTYFRQRDSKTYPPFLRELLKDSSPAVRGEAIRRLFEHHVFLGPAELPESFEVPFVGDFRWRDPAEMARVRNLAQAGGVQAGWAIHALGLVGDAEAAGPAQALFDSSNAFVRHAAAKTLLRLSRTEDALTALRRLTDSPGDENGYYRCLAAEDLARLGESQAFEVLFDGLESTDRQGSVFATRVILEDLTGRYFVTAAEARAWRNSNAEAEPAPAPNRRPR